MKRGNILAIYMCLIYLCLSTTVTAEAESSDTNTTKTSSADNTVTAEVENSAPNEENSDANKQKKNELSDAAKEYGYFSSQNWCAGETTIPFNKDRRSFSGVRLLFEPNFGFLVQRGKNEFDSKNFPNLSKFALETNIYKGWVALQLGFVSPSTIKFDPVSPVVKNKSLIDGDAARVKWGLTGGLSFIDGWISMGVGGIWYHSSSFVDCYKGNPYDGFIFLNLQPVSLVQSTIRSIRSLERSGDTTEKPEEPTKKSDETAKESEDTTEKSEEAANE